MAIIQNNFERMLKLIDEVFATRNDVNQIQVTESQRKKLGLIHPATLTELADENGPLIWLLVVPTTSSIMHDFLAGRITEKQLLKYTPLHTEYDSIYLCSVTTLPEARGKGWTKKLLHDSIQAIVNDHPVNSLFVWPFTAGGLALAKSAAEAFKLSLHEFYPSSI